MDFDASYMRDRSSQEAWLFLNHLSATIAVECIADHCSDRIRQKRVICGLATDSRDDHDQSSQWKMDVGAHQEFRLETHRQTQLPNQHV